MFIERNRVLGMGAAALCLVAGLSVGVAQAQDEQPELNQPGGVVNVDENLITELFVNDEDLNTVLQLLGIQAQKNIVTGQSVAGRVTANFFGVTFYEALDAILNVNGYGYIERGSFIYVYGLEELERIEEATRTRKSEVVNLNYISAIDLQAFVEPMLSDIGSITISPEAGEFQSPGDTPTGAEDFAGVSTVVVTDYEETVDEILLMIERIDTRPAQVLVEATILQTSLNEANAFGMDFSIIDDLDFSDFVGSGGPLGVIPSLISGQGGTLVGGSETPIAAPADGNGGGVTSTSGNTTGPATLRAGVVSGDIAVFLRLLDEVTDTTILSTPKILTLNRQSARVLVGEKVGYLSTTSTETATTQTVEFLDTGTQLYMRPFVSDDGFIRMELKPQVSTAEIRTVTDSGGAAVTIPDELTNELVTNVMVRDGQTVVLGGLFRGATTATRRQVPFLGDIPILGAPFRGHDDATERQEIVFLIKPTIVNDKVLLDQADRALAMVERVRVGARNGLLPWSREKLTAMYNLEAERLFRNGEYSRALHKVQRSLNLNPNQADAIQLRERLIGEQSRNPHRSVLQEIIDGELNRMIEQDANENTDASDVTFRGIPTDRPSQDAIQRMLAEAEARRAAEQQAETPAAPGFEAWTAETADSSEGVEQTPEAVEEDGEFADFPIESDD
jgi:type II secretory pathway component GspD/PulD (secretin)